MIGDYPDATAVFDVDSIGLTNVVSRLNRGIDIGGQPIGAPTAFHIGVAANPGALNLDDEVRRFRYKVEAGAEFAITQPVFEVGALAAVPRPGRRRAHPGPRRHPAARPACGTPSSWPTRCPGVNVPDIVLDRMREADAAGRAADEGIAIAREVIAGIRPLVQGLQITTAAGAIDVCARRAGNRRGLADVGVWLAPAGRDAL